MSSSSERTRQAIVRARHVLEQRRAEAAAGNAASGGCSSLVVATAAPLPPQRAIEITQATVNPMRDDEGRERLLQPSLTKTYTEDGGIDLLGTNRLRSGYVVKTPTETLFAFSLFANHPTDFPLSSWCLRDIVLQKTDDDDDLAPEISRTHCLVDVYTLIYLTQGVRQDSQCLFLGRREHKHTDCAAAETCSRRQDVKINAIFWHYHARTDERWQAHFEVLSETQQACSEVLRLHYDNAIKALLHTIDAKPSPPPPPPSPHTEPVDALASTLAEVVSLHESGQSMSTSE